MFFDKCVTDSGKKCKQKPKQNFASISCKHLNMAWLIDVFGQMCYSILQKTQVKIAVALISLIWIQKNQKTNKQKCQKHRKIKVYFWVNSIYAVGINAPFQNRITRAVI